MVVVVVVVAQGRAAATVIAVAAVGWLIVWKETKDEHDCEVEGRHGGAQLMNTHCSFHDCFCLCLCRCSLCPSSARTHHGGRGSFAPDRCRPVSRVLVVVKALVKELGAGAHAFTHLLQAIKRTASFDCTHTLTHSLTTALAWFGSQVQDTRRLFCARV